MFDLSFAEWIAAVGIPIAVIQLWMGRRHARASFEHNFVARYWKLEDDLAVGSVSESTHAKRYLRLCEDQFELMRLGQISWATWEVWHDGIVQGLAGIDISRSIDVPDFTGTCIRSGKHSGLSCPSLFEVAGAGIDRSIMGPSRNLLVARRVVRAWRRR